jgi:hypothetical protein
MNYLEEKWRRNERIRIALVSVLMLAVLAVIIYGIRTVLIIIHFKCSV